MSASRRPLPIKAAPPKHGELDACRRCDLWRHATQGVPGEGGARPALMLVGEQPGDQEDVDGRPFVGPAGQLLRSLIEEAGLDAGNVYITNAVKHFSWEPRGKRRLHKTPAQREIEACRVWLDREIESLRPKVIVALGVTALSALLGRRMTLKSAREQEMIRHAVGAPLVPTFHPSAVLRAPDQAGKAALRATLLADLKDAARLAGLA